MLISFDVSVIILFKLHLLNTCNNVHSKNNAFIKKVRKVNKEGEKYCSLMEKKSSFVSLLLSVCDNCFSFYPGFTEYCFLLFLVIEMTTLGGRQKEKTAENEREV